jgi:hypothetical protein
MPGKNSDTRKSVAFGQRFRPLPFTPERRPVPVGEWPLHIAAINFSRFAAEVVTKRPFHF